MRGGDIIVKRKCNCCRKVFEHGVSANMIIFCPYCKNITGSISEYGFGPITPCDIYLGDQIIGHISNDYFLSSPRFNIQQKLTCGYKDLAAYQETEDILRPYLAQLK